MAVARSRRRTRTIDVLPCDAGALLARRPVPPAHPARQAGLCQTAFSSRSTPVLQEPEPEIFVAGLTSKPPAGACAGFDTNTNGVQIDIRPLTTPGNFEIKIPKAALGNKKWWQTDVCVGTNLRFITKIGSLANLRPGASCGLLSPTLTCTNDRWWGLLPSIPRYANFPGRGLVKGPYITFRGPGTGTNLGGAVIRFTVPYVAGSAGLTTNGTAGYDPRSYCC